MNNQNINNNEQDGNIDNQPAPRERPVSPSSASENGEEESAVPVNANASDNAKRTKHQEQPDGDLGADNATDQNHAAAHHELNNNHQQQQQHHSLPNAHFPPPHNPHPHPPPQPGLMYPMLSPYFPSPPFDPTQSHPQAFPPNPLFSNFLPHHHPHQHPTIAVASSTAVHPLGTSSTPSDQLDATRIFYERQMREHAMQYANAAAGAAWAAARIAYGDHNHNSYTHPPLPPPSSSSGHLDGSIPLRYVPASSLGGWMENDSGGGVITGRNEPVNHTHSNLNPRQRKLWKPSKTNDKKESKPESSDQQSIASSEKERTKSSKQQQQQQHHDIQRSKKREKSSGTTNDSVSSLGSGSRDRSHPHSSHHKQPRNNNTKQRNQRQNKRGLYQSYSPRGSSSSLGTMGSTGRDPSSTNNNYRHKRRNTESLTSPRMSGGSSSVFLGGLIGKSGTCALHELCSKYRWEMPKYELIEPCGGGEEEGSSVKNQSGGQDFILSVRVNGVELGRGRGGTKGSSKQDASRKALAALIPGVVFDPNGILMDIGTGLLRIIDENSRSVPTSLEELAPHLASQLAIGVSPNEAPAAHQRPYSPDISESSSISTAVSMTKSRGEDVRVSLGGLLQSTSGGGLGSNSNAGIYPSASSASEFEEEDENAHRSSGDARVCSTLLHAMWQIDYRIREPPKFKYAFDLLQGGNGGGGGESIPSKEEADVPPSTDSTPHRLPFQCTATLGLGFSKRLLGGNEPTMEYWESPLEHLQSKPSAKSPQRNADKTNEQSRKRKDSFTSQATPSPARQQHKEVDSTELPSSTALSSPEQDELITHLITSTATAPTKRESKHKASVKLLTMLFPECSSIVEVMAAAEAARESYAVKKKAQTKRAKLSNEHSLDCENQKSLLSPTAAGILSYAEQDEGRTKKNISEQKWIDHSTRKTEDGATDGYFSVAGLSLSEPTNSKEDLECEMDAAIRSVCKQMANCEGTMGYRVRCANPDDFEWICALLKKSPDKHEPRPSEADGVSPESDFSLQPRGLVVVLLLVRANSPRCDQPLGVTILSLFEKVKERTLSAHVIKHDDHISLELFTAQLNKLASILDCSLDVSSILDDSVNNSSSTISFIRDHIYEKASIQLYDKHQELSSSHLQSVLEEDSDVADGSEEEEGNELAGRKRSRVEH